MSNKLTRYSAQEYSAMMNEEDSKYLNSSILYDITNHIQIPVRKTYNDLCVLLNTKKDCITLKTILYNLYRALKISDKIQKPYYVAISLDRSNYINKTQWQSIHLSYTKIKKSLNKLEELGLIDIHLGFNNKENKELNRMTRINATEKLADIFHSHDKEYIYNPPLYPVWVENTKGVISQPPNRRKFDSLCSQANRINNSNNSHNIHFKLPSSSIPSITQMQNGFESYNQLESLDKVDKNFASDNNATYMTLLYALQKPYINRVDKIRISEASLTYRRVFKDGSFDVYGRFHSPLQQLPKALRKALTIDGEAVVELDYTSTFPSILFASIGVEMAEDPYIIEDYTRAEVKWAINMILNSRSRVSASQALMKQMGYANRLEYYQNLMCRVEEHFDPISHWFYTEAWKTLTNVESNICNDVMMHFVRRKEVCISIHDSFVVRTGLEDELHKAMTKAWQKHTGHQPQIKREY